MFCVPQDILFQSLLLGVRAVKANTIQAYVRKVIPTFNQVQVMCIQTSNHHNSRTKNHYHHRTMFTEPHINNKPSVLCQQLRPMSISQVIQVMEWLITRVMLDGKSEVLCNTEVREILGLEPEGVEEVQIMTFGSESTTLDDYNSPFYFSSQKCNQVNCWWCNRWSTFLRKNTLTSVDVCTFWLLSKWL